MDDRRRAGGAIAGLDGGQRGAGRARVVYLVRDVSGGEMRVGRQGGPLAGRGFHTLGESCARSVR